MLESKLRREGNTMKIGIIGAGHVGKVLAKEWVQAGHEVMVSSRHPNKLKGFAKNLGPKVKAGTPEEAAKFGDVVLLSIPLGEVQHLSKEVRNALKGKVVLDTCNPYIERDKEAGTEALNSPDGSGVWISKHIPGAKLVKAFNTIFADLLESESHRGEEPIGVPLASDHSDALEVASMLVMDAGFGPLVVGELRRAKDFDNGTEAYGSGASPSELKRIFGQKRKAA